jgi:hypothetical protein
MDDYDVIKDMIIMSADFQNCDYKDSDDGCLLTDGIPKCWHVDFCPDGKERTNV